MNIPLAQPQITPQDRQAVLGVLKTKQLSLGPKLVEFEKKMADYIGVKYAIAVSSGTAGLHLIVRALDLKKDDEVITTPFSFIASSNCLLYEQVKPVFVDIDPQDLNIDTAKIESAITPKTKAILAVDIFGQPAPWLQLRQIAAKHHLALIEDSAESLGSEYQNQKCGSLGDAGVFAFYPNKQITTGEGGMVVTNNKKIAELCYCLRNQGRDSNHWLKHQHLGYNYRLSELNCALGISQLSRINQIILRRQKIAATYNQLLKNIPGIILPNVASTNKVSWFVYVIQIKNRDQVMARLKQQGVQCNNYFPVIHLTPFYQKKFGYKKGDFPIAEAVSQKTLALPFFNQITPAQIKYVVQQLLKAL